MTDFELERLERLEKAATPGPWGTTRYSGGFSFSGPLRLYSGTNEEFGEPDPIRFENEANIRFIAAARNALPELIAEIRQLRGILPEPIKIPNAVLESNILPLENLVLPANGPVIMSLNITETDGAFNP